MEKKTLNLEIMEMEQVVNAQPPVSLCPCPCGVCGAGIGGMGYGIIAEGIQAVVSPNALNEMEAALLGAYNHTDPNCVNTFNCTPECPCPVPDQDEGISSNGGIGDCADCGIGTIGGVDGDGGIGGIAGIGGEGTVGGGSGIGDGGGGGGAAAGGGGGCGCGGCGNGDH